MASIQGNASTQEGGEQKGILGRTTDDAMSYPREEWMQREGPCLVLPLPKALNKAGEGGLSESRRSMACY